MTSPGEQNVFGAEALPIELSAEELAVAEEFLGALSQALFPQGQPSQRLMTWPDEAEVRPLTEDGGAASSEARAQKAEARFRTLVEQIPAVTFMAVLGEGENEVYVSPHVEQMLGYTQEEWLSDPFLWYNRLHPDDRALWNEQFGIGCRTGGPFRAECRFRARDGSTVWVHGEARLVKDERGRPQFLQGVAFDITESKRAQELLLDHAVSRARIEEEMEIARRVQTSLLPRDPRVDSLEISAAMQPADDVGGDYYDIIRTETGAWLAIGDVSGHGLNAGLVMLMVQSAMATLTQAQRNGSPREMLATINEVVFENVSRRLARDEYVTMTLLRYTNDGQIVFAGAHQKILVWRKLRGEVERINTPGMWLGVQRDILPWLVDGRFSLAPGDVMVLFTDGIIECRNDEGEQLDVRRLCDVIAERHDAPTAEIRDAILTAARVWSRVQEDDRTVVVVRYAPATLGG